MSISVNDSMYSYVTQTAQNANNSAAAGSISSSLQGISENSTEAEMKDAIRDFESYFIEQLLKEVEESMTSDEDSSNSQLTEYFMGQVNEQIADKLLDQTGERLTQTLYEQMCRNYNITPAETEE